MKGESFMEIEGEIKNEIENKWAYEILNVKTDQL